MHFTVRRKIVLGVAVIVALGAMSLFIVYQGLRGLHHNLRELNEQEGPIVQAAYEMEINLVELAAHVLRYMDTLDPGELESIRSDRQDFERFHREHARLSTTPQSQKLAAQVQALYDEFIAVADKMIANRDAESARFAELMQNIEAMDELLDARLEARIDRTAAGALEKLVDSIDLEADIGEIGIWLANYRQTRRDRDRDRIWSNIEEFREQAARLRRNPYLTAAERRTVAEVERFFRDTEIAIQAVLASDAQVVEYGKRFEVLRTQLDDLLDEELQVLALKGLDRPIVEADAAVVEVAWRAGVLLPLFLLSACVVAGLLTVNLTRSVSRLMEGTASVRSGDLSARIAAEGHDELDDLAANFNQMVEQLEATTVSKVALEASEAELRTAYDELRQQVADRERAEAAERRLRAELQRTEMLARIGSLVAGVAHEARNPLFGISSTVDALAARLSRLATQEAYADHLAVLRREIARLSTLTRDLLEYGRPAGLDITSTHAGDVLDRAMQACQPLVQQAGVTMARRIATDVNNVMLDAARMVQVLQNLLENAIHYSPRGTTVTVDVRRVLEHDREWVRYEVMDQGPGIHPDDLAHIFEPFFSRRARGTGLGLSIVERIVDQHGGRAAARNGDGGGAVLTVDVPLDREADAANTGGRRAAQDSDRRRRTFSAVRRA
jgi:signal transduction histidine kinase